MTLFYIVQPQYLHEPTLCPVVAHVLILPRTCHSLGLSPITYTLNLHSLEKKTAFNICGKCFLERCDDIFELLMEHHCVHVQEYPHHNIKPTLLRANVFDETV